MSEENKNISRDDVYLGTGFMQGRKHIKVDNCGIPHNCLHELVDWAEKYNLTLIATGELEEILTKYFK